MAACRDWAEGGTGAASTSCRARTAPSHQQGSSSPAVADRSLPISDNVDGNWERNRGYRANSMRKAGAQPISSQKSHIIYQSVREAIRLKFALAVVGIADRETDETCPPAFNAADP